MLNVAPVEQLSTTFPVPDLNMTLSTRTHHRHAQLMATGTRKLVLEGEKFLFVQKKENFRSK